MGIPYVQLNREEYAVLGSAIVAGYAVGTFTDLKATAQGFVEATSRIEPRPQYHAYYRPLVDLYISLSSTTKPIFQHLAEIPSLSQEGGA